MKKIVTTFLLLAFSATQVYALPQEQNGSGIRVNPYSATITWMTDKPSTSQIEFGPDNSFTDTTPEDQDLVIYHKVTIFDLKPSTHYNYRIISKDAYGNEALSECMTFKTLPVPSRDEPPRISDIEASVIVAAGPVEAEEPASAPMMKIALATSADEKPVGEEEKQMIKKEAAVKKALTKQKGILLKKGRWHFEPSTTYVHTSANKIAIEGYVILPLIIGQISTENIKRDIVIHSLAARYGLTNNTQIDVNVPFRHQRERVVVDSPASETVRRTSGIGDVSAGISRQILYEKGWRPDVIAGLSFKSRTGKAPYGRDIGLGTGHYAVKGSLVAVKSSDPAVLFGSLGYTYNFERDNISGYGTIDPGDTINYGLGMAFALNYQVALSFQLQQSVTQKTLLNGSSISDSFTNVAKMKTGLTWSMSKNSSAELAVAYGLTADSPDLIVELSFPFKF